MVVGALGATWTFIWCLVGWSEVCRLRCGGFGGMWATLNETGGELGELVAAVFNARNWMGNYLRILNTNVQILSKI